MSHLIDDLLKRLETGTGMSLIECVWAVLGVCLIFSTGHLISMLITRWGDRRADGKSLMFSLALHVACMMGACGMHLQSQLNDRSLEAGEQTVMPVRKLVLDDEDQPVVRDNGDNPVWDKLPPPLESKVARTQREAPDKPTAETPDRSDVPAPRAEMTLPELAMMSTADSATNTPQPAEPEEAAPRVDSPAPAPLESVPAPEARPDVALSSAPASRDRNVREGGAPTEVVRTSSPGAAERIAKQPDVDRVLASISAPMSPAGTLPRPARAADEVMRRTGPAPSETLVDEPGAPAVPTQAAAGNRSESSSGDIRSRSLRGRIDGSRESLRPERTIPGEPSTGDRSMAVRERLPFESMRNGPAPALGEVDGNPFQVRGAGIPATYRLRSLARRREVARKYGGNEASEKAVEASLRWFASVQLPDGSWDGDRYGAGQVKIDEQKIDRDYAGKDSDAGLTALVILSFLGAGYTHEEGQYADNVDRALKWLIANQRADGYLGVDATHYSQMYCHGMATYALAEACGMQNDPAANPAMRETLQKAVEFILSRQNPNDGGWRYVKDQAGDMSMFGWQLMALKSAEIAGLRIPPNARAKMIEFLRERSLGDAGGLAGYREGAKVPTPSMTAEALFCKQMLGLNPNNPQSREAVGYLLARLPKRSEFDEYYWYYGTLAMYQYGGQGWTMWNDALRELLTDEQVTSGEFAGSWDPKGKWGRYGGRIYQTALSTLCLEVYYRFLPLHQLNDYAP